MTYIDPSLARGLCKNALSAFVAQAKINDERLFAIVIGGQMAQIEGRPAGRMAKETAEKLRELFSRSSGYGHLVTLKGRKAFYVYLTPQLENGDLVFSEILGRIDGRRGVMRADILPILRVSRHAIERMFQRLRTFEPAVVLREVLSALLLSMRMHVAASSVGAPQFPLPTAQGLFVATASYKGGMRIVTAITWLAEETLTPRWQRVIADLRAIETLELNSVKDVAHALESPEWMELDDVDDIARVLRAHSWLCRPYEPVGEVEDEWWRAARAAEGASR